MIVFPLKYLYKKNCNFFRKFSCLLNFIMEELNEAGDINYKPIKKLVDLEIERLYKITEAKVVKTKYGDSVLITVENEFVVFLPKRFNEISREALQKLKSAFFQAYYKDKDSKYICLNFFNSNEKILLPSTQQSSSHSKTTLNKNKRKKKHVSRSTSPE